MDQEQTNLSISLGGQTCLVHLLSIIRFSPSNKFFRLNPSLANAKPHTPSFSEPNSSCYYIRSLLSIMPLLHIASANTQIGCGSGASDGLRKVSLFKRRRGAVESRIFPPLEHNIVKAIACELPSQDNAPLSRYSLSDLARRVEQEPEVRPMSRATIHRILQRDAIKPWQHHCWIFPRDPHFVDKASVVLDLYAGFWEGKPLSEDDYIISADEKTSIQARIRLAQTVAPGVGCAMRYEHEYERGGALQYLAGWDVRRGLPIGVCEPKTGIEPFHRLIDKVMTQDPYSKARRVFWIVDGGSSHRGEAFANRLRSWYGNAIDVSLPVHASWLNQIEIYFSIVQRKVLTPNDFINLKEVERRLMGFEAYYGEIAEPFDWRFTSEKLEQWYKRLQGWEELCRAA